MLNLAPIFSFTAGGIGALTLGMMARVALGHTGRMLEPAPLMALAFVAVNLAALIRVALPLFSPRYTCRASSLPACCGWPRSACSPRFTRPSCCAHGSMANPVE